MRSNRGAWYGSVLSTSSGFDVRAEFDAGAGVEALGAGYVAQAATRIADVTAAARTERIL
jgi:hypothetical protein